MVPHIPALSGKKTGAARPAGAPSDSARGLRTTGPPKPPVASPGEPAVSDPGLPQEARRTGPARGRARCLGITRPFRKELRGARGAAVRWGWGALGTREHPRPSTHGLAPTAASSRPVLGAASGARRRGRRKTAFSVTGSSEQGTEGNESPGPRQGRRALRSLRPRGRVPGRGRIPGTAKGSQATPRLTQQAAGARPRCLGPAAGVSGLAPTRHH